MKHSWSNFHLLFGKQWSQTWIKHLYFSTFCLPDDKLENTQWLGRKKRRNVQSRLHLSNLTYLFCRPALYCSRRDDDVVYRAQYAISSFLSHFFSFTLSFVFFSSFLTLHILEAVECTSSHTNHAYIMKIKHFYREQIDS